VYFICAEAKKRVGLWIKWSKQQGYCDGKELLRDFEEMVLPVLSFIKSGINLNVMGEEGLRLIRHINMTISDIYLMLQEYVEECEYDSNR